PYKISKSCLKKVLGNYRLTLNFSKKELKENELPSSVLNAEIKLHDNKIIFTSPFTPGSKLILIPISKNKFMCRDSRWTLTFGKDKNGNEIFTWKIKNYSFILHKEND
ncbi:MAG TPA: hypothetical protein QF753_19820, partial [Victivallales bacterium]|nr:hypothetical protein [Victivallales bacterium]